MGFKMSKMGAKPKAHPDQIAEEADEEEGEVASDSTTEVAGGADADDNSRKKPRGAASGSRRGSSASRSIPQTSQSDVSGGSNARSDGGMTAEQAADQNRWICLSGEVQHTTPNPP